MTQLHNRVVRLERIVALIRRVYACKTERELAAVQRELKKAMAE